MRIRRRLPRSRAIEYARATLDSATSHVRDRCFQYTVRTRRVHACSVKTGGGKAGNQGSRVLERSLLPFLLNLFLRLPQSCSLVSLVSLCLFLALPPSHHFQKHIYHRTHCAHRIHRTHILNKLSHNKLCDITCVSCVCLVHVLTDSVYVPYRNLYHQLQCDSKHSSVEHSNSVGVLALQVLREAHTF